MTGPRSRSRKYDFEPAPDPEPPVQPSAEALALEYLSEIEALRAALRAKYGEFDIEAALAELREEHG